jgi:hypothetical protein
MAAKFMLLNAHLRWQQYLCYSTYSSYFSFKIIGLTNNFKQFANYTYCYCLFIYLLLLSLVLQPSAGYGLLVSRGFLITHNDASQSVGLLWTSDQLGAQTSTWQHTTDKYPCLRWDSNPRSQQASGRRPTPYAYCYTRYIFVLTWKIW